MLSVWAIILNWILFFFNYFRNARLTYHEINYRVFPIKMEKVNQGRGFEKKKKFNGGLVFRKDPLRTVSHWRVLAYTSLYPSHTLYFLISLAAFARSRPPICLQKFLDKLYSWIQLNFVMRLNLKNLNCSLFYLRQTPVSLRFTSVLWFVSLFGEAV